MTTETNLENSSTDGIDLPLGVLPLVLGDDDGLQKVTQGVLVASRMVTVARSIEFWW